MKRIGGLVLGAVACTGVLASCALPGGLGARVHGGESGGLHDFADGQSGGGSADSGVADVTATTVEESDAAADDADTGRGVLPPLGTFDRTVPGFRVFDPCSEIPSEVLAEAGLEALPSKPYRDSDMIFCGFEYREGGEHGIVNLASTSVDEIADTDTAEGGDLYVGELLPVRAQEDSISKDHLCRVVLETHRGYVMVSYSAIAKPVSFSEQCRMAEIVMNKLI